MLLWIAYLVVIFVSELIVLESAPLGIGLYLGIATVLLVQAGFSPPVDRSLLVALSLAPVIRVSSLAMPLAELPPQYWFVAVSLPVFAAALIAASVMAMSRPDLGLRVGNVLLQLSIGVLGVPIGLLEYLILRPTPYLDPPTWGNLILLLAIFLFCTGFVEEFAFRGVLQSAALTRLGNIGLLYVSGVYAILQIGNRTGLHLAVVLCIGLLFSVLVARSKSILGVSLAHGLANFVLFAAMPYLFAQHPFG